ncbi:Phytocyanin domain-containing protein [Heracleum sosnowskyi]|uniref:Phytocyanin domain-containing protein n=1 Tax=Heracleum sosnowskyi TaxID=360622 RepID=A0AAD8HEX8_9APIA|nr:Phytocyanin domain-containing protein [Heracleum sosnowskyi]
MAASYNLLIVLAIASVTATMASTEFWVGGSSGWTINFDYQAWASDKVFHVGDTLVFSYPQGAHNVFKVNGTGFADCIKPTSNDAVLKSGHDVITLSSTGKKWYICAVKTHCSELKQKLVINVEEAEAPAPAPTSSANGIFTSSYQVFLVAAVALGIIAVM